MDSFLEDNFFMKLLHPFVFRASLEFSIIYAMLKPVNQSHFLSIMLVLTHIYAQTCHSDMYSISTNAARLLGTFLYGLINYNLCGNWNSVFLYCTLNFLRSPLTYTFGEDSKVLLITFYLYFSVILITSILTCQVDGSLNSLLWSLRLLLVQTISLIVLCSLVKMLVVCLIVFLKEMSEIKEQLSYRDSHG